MTKSTYPATVGGRIRDERLRLRMTITEFASAAGVNDRVVSNWEADKDAPGYGVMLHLALAGVDVNFIVIGWPSGRPVSAPPYNAASPAVRAAFAAFDKLPVQVRHSLLHIWLQQELDA